MLESTAGGSADLCRTIAFADRLHVTARHGIVAADVAAGGPEVDASRPRFARREQGLYRLRAREVGQRGGFGL